MQVNITKRIDTPEGKRYHCTLHDFFLMSGFREQETMHVVWSNVRFNSNIIEM